MKVVVLDERERFEALRSLRPVDFLRLWPGSALHAGRATVAEVLARVAAAQGPERARLEDARLAATLVVAAERRARSALP